ncbi:hypothetical protein TELCIR_02647 [Teladorsagia circumcincta]|uniref:Uncharacterized protein n=1 Tax=Teladorsagia circumcincta TaxID=45464 RepID=A0A2G9UYT5_TELCI|nr:hypothetical protein TELCIR_02647 [Teladorsagia circumcincta]
MQNGIPPAVLGLSTILIMLCATRSILIQKNGLEASFHSLKIRKERKNSTRHHMTLMENRTSFGSPSRQRAH